ncbi:ABC transporter permease subunit [Microvirga sp. 0TCS3.31]
MDFSWVSEFWPILLGGLWRTLLLLVLGALFGFALAIPVAVARISRNPILYYLSGTFTTVIRGTPLLVQIYILYYGVGSLLAATPEVRTSIFWPYLRDGFWYVVVSLAISVAAYEGELLRGGLLSVAKGQLEAARAFGMSSGLMFRRIWLPSALRMLLPTLVGDTVLLLKSTALASTVAVVDLVGAANQVRTHTFLVYEPLLTVALVYLIITAMVTSIAGLISQRGPQKAV